MHQLEHANETPSGNGSLTHRQQLAIAAILASPSMEEARRRMKAAKGTFYGWMKEPVFQAELTRQKRIIQRKKLW